MIRAHSQRRKLIVALLAASTTGTVAAAADRNTEFVAALRAAGWDDTAVQFIDWVEVSPLMTDEFGRQISFERAVSLAAQGRQSRDRNEQTQLLRQAAENFQQFAGDDPESTRALDALRQSAHLYVELALAKLAVAAPLPDETAAAEIARREAREGFDHAATATEQLLGLCTDRLADLPKPTVIQSDPEAKALRDLLRNRQAEARFLLALISFESARAYEPESDERREALGQAWNGFGKLHEEFRDTQVGSSSRLYQGRCAQQQGDYAKALGCYQDLIQPTPVNPEFRRLAARAFRYRAECYLAQDKPDDAIRECEEWLSTSRPEERKNPEWLEVAFRLADSYQAHLKNSDNGARDAKRVESEVRTLLRDVADDPNEFQREARLALASLAQRGAGTSDFANFSEALAAGRTALELMSSSKLAARLASENNPDAVAELENDAVRSRDDARRAFETAVDLADRQTPLEQINMARYYLCALDWEDGRLEDAAVLGEFIASRYPEHEFAPNAANIALWAWDKLHRESRAAAPAGADAGAFAGRKLAETAQLVASRWPNAPEADRAVSILINVALGENRIDEAEELLAKLPANRRASAELTLGAALWRQYLQTTEGRDAQFDEAANALREKAAGLLSSGFAAYRDAAEPSAGATISTLCYVQLLLSRGEWQPALEALEDLAVGPLTLVQSESDAAAQPEVMLETYKLALRAYLAAQPPRRDEAQDAMKSLDEFVAKQGGDATEKLASVYLSLGLQLQRQMKDLSAAGQDARAEEVAAAFGDVLARVAARPNGGDWKLLNWVAQTNLQIGQGLRGDRARPYLERAQQSLEAVLAAAQQGNDGAPDAAQVLGVRKRLADCLVAMGKYQQGVEQYALLLRDRPAMLDVQQAAAAAYQAWGAAEERPEAIDQAIRGAAAGRDGRNLVWGWLRLATAADGARRRAAEMAASDAKAAQDATRYTEIFFEARYNIARARFLGATIAQGGARRDQLEAAQKNIESMRTLYPDLGGPKWKAAFESLLKQIGEELTK